MLDGFEWLIVGGIAIAFLLWGPAKIPEFAKALGRAKGEFDNASREFQNAAISTTTLTTPSTAQTVKVSASSQPTMKTKQEVLLDTAHSLGLQTEGKTQQQISEELSAVVKNLGSG